jgi:hypothetical protein
MEFPCAPGVVMECVAWEVAPDPKRLGLLHNHAYSIIQISFDLQDEQGQGPVMLKLRNPWGLGEWTGPWSDKWEGWEHEAEAKEKLGYSDRKDGSFWMEADDFLAQFNMIYMADIHPKQWNSLRMTGNWIKESTAGGGFQLENAMEWNPAWKTNPAFKILPDPETDVTIAHVVLAQPDARLPLLEGNNSKWNFYKRSIGFVVYKSKTGETPAKNPFCSVLFCFVDVR